MGREGKQQRIFEFLRYSIDTRAAIPDYNKVDWNQLYDFAKKQALVGVMFQGVQRLPDGVFCDVNLLAQWTVTAQKIRMKNKLLNERCLTVQHKFAKAGFRSCILKGQGIATLYPDPMLRTPGDIDIWLAPTQKDKRRYPYRQIVCKYVEQHTPGQKARYHHIDFPIYEDVPIEVHFTPSYMYAPWDNHRMQAWFERNADLQYSNKVSLSDGAGEIAAPTISFNLVYITSHLYRHMFSEGIGLRQLLDYYYVLLNSDDIMRRVAQLDIEYLGMKQFASAVMWGLQEVFDLKDEYLLFSPNAKEGQFLLNEILVGGNFGHYDNRLGDKASESFLRKHIRMTMHNLRLAKHYPSVALCELVFRFTQAIKEKLRYRQL